MMRRLEVAALVAAAVVAHAGLAGATPQDAHERRIAKYAVPVAGAQVKGVCVCQNGGSRHGEAGVLTWAETLSPTPGFVEIRAHCLVSTYDLAGEPDIGIPCNPYVVLAR